MHQQLLAGLARPIDRVRSRFSYRIGLLLVACVMLALPLIYVAAICATAYGLYIYSVLQLHALAAAKDLRMQLVTYFAPLLAGLLLLLFLIKPLFARRFRSKYPLSLTPLEQPTLFAFVGRLCELVGAPKPMRIDVDTAVNASAGFDEGLGSFLRGRLVLTVGLPLVASLSLRQLTGVFAHELGHFGQGTGCA